MDIKKMLAVGTAIIGTAVTAEGIVSSSVVGYLGNDMKASGATMASGSFAAVTAANGSCTLADFTVSGYDAPEWNEEDEEYTGGCNGTFVVQFLTSSGTVEASYRWYDNGEVTPGWYNNNGSAISGGAASVTISAGQAMWIQGRGMKLTSAGAVNEEDIAFLTRSSGASAIGNATPIDHTLGKLVVTGYDAPEWNEEDEEYTGGCNGTFVVQFLTSSGTVEASYRWYDNGEVAPGWYNNNGSAISGGATSVDIPAGQGLWVQGRGMTLTIPAPELN